MVYRNQDNQQLYLYLKLKAHATRAGAAINRQSHFPPSNVDKFKSYKHMAPTCLDT